nr:zinc finger, CCHC-type, retrotransposon Gag domain protein [Tanacetum cinerariifolium]
MVRHSLNRELDTFRPKEYDEDIIGPEIPYLSEIEACMYLSSNTRMNIAFSEFKELFNAEYAPAKEVDKIQEEFQTFMQTNEMINELWKKFNDLVPYCPEYHGNEKLKVKRFQRMLRNDIREVISPFKCTTLDDLLSRARVREADLLRRKNKEAKKTKRKLNLEIEILRSLSMITVEEVVEPKPKHHVKSVIKLILDSVGQICPVATIVML